MMKLTGRGLAKWIVILLLTLGLSSANACLCFSVNYLHHLFFLDKKTRCFAHTVDDVYVSATVINGKNSASSNEYGCDLNLGGRYYRREYTIIHDNMLCIAAILASCRTIAGDDYRRK